MQKRLFIGIGVSTPTGMDSLPGVHDVIRRIARYAARSSEYDPPILFLDGEGQRVTAEQIKKDLTADILVDRPRIMVYFCGHGAFVNGQEIWYLSDGKAQWSQRVLVSTFRDTLQTYGPQQIGLFSDACQIAESGIGTGSPILDAHEGEAETPKYDVFRATIRGQPAYATPAEGPLFSKVIADVLNDNPPESALDELYLRIGEHVVSSQSLANYVEKNLPDYVALSAGKRQPTEIASGFRYHTNDYLKLPHIPALSTHRVPSDRTRNNDEAKLTHVLDASSSEWRGVFWSQTEGLLAEQTKRPNVVIVIAGADYIDRVAETVALATPDGRNWRQDISRSDGWLAISIWIDDYGAAFERGQPFMAVLSVDGLHVPLELQKDPETVVLELNFGRDGPLGAGALGWNGRESKYQLGYSYRPMEVLKALMTGLLTADLVQPLAAQLRDLKHKDPLYGIAAAYLYDRIGDLDGIRRMCLFYADHKQGVPFDIALLSRLKFDWDRGEPGFRINVPDIAEDSGAEKTLPGYVWEAKRGKRNLIVAGIAPVLQAGWARLATLRPHPLFQEFLGLQHHLTAAPFATFQGDAAYQSLRGLLDIVGERSHAAEPA